MQLQQISVQELAQALETNDAPFLLDVRNFNEYEHFNLGGHLIPLVELEQRVNENPTRQTYRSVLPFRLP